MKQQANSLIYDQNLIGRTGMVTTSIPVNGLGEVLIHIPGQAQFTRTATSKKPIASGRSVKIVQVIGNNLEVEEV